MHNVFIIQSGRNWKTEYFFGNFSQIIDEKYNGCRKIFVCDKEVYKYYKAGIKNEITLLLEATENKKTLATVHSLYKKLMKLQADRDTVLIAIGGGITGDIAGFLASTFYRGLRLVLVPTTLLAMADASTGGKNGVNFFSSKNLIGNIKQPEVIIIDTRFLKTLHITQLRSGMAEVIKHGLISGKYLLGDITNQHFIDKLFRKKEISPEIILKNIKIKSDIVLDDELEANKRKILNFGHTIGHIVEAKTKILHGEAVSIGMVYAAKISQELNKCSSGTVKTVTGILKQYKLPTETTLNKSVITGNFVSDKKKRSNVIDFIFIKSPGNVACEEMFLSELQNLIFRINSL